MYDLIWIKKIWKKRKKKEYSANSEGAVSCSVQSKLQSVEEIRDKIFFLHL